MKPLSPTTIPRLARRRAPIIARFLAAMCLLLCLRAAARAQVAVADARALVGNEARLPVRYLGKVDTLSVFTLSGDLTLSNPTVFFPQRFVAPSGDSSLVSTLTRMTDSTYVFSVTLRFDLGERPRLDTLCSLAGEALAGFDSICVVTLSNLAVNGISQGSASGRLITTSVGTPLPYVRYATLERNYPNPVLRGVTTRWAYRIDKQSQVDFIIYNDLGEEVIVMDLGVQAPGVHFVSLTPGYDVSVGVYWARLHTNSGDFYQPMHVLR